MNNKALANDVLDNMQKYTVNPVEKMDRTIDKMCDNHMVKIKKGMKAHMREHDAAAVRGYGENRKLGG